MPLKKHRVCQTILILLTLISIRGAYTEKASAQDIPQAECLSAYGQTKCGYHCEAGYGEIRCAEWPGGACQAAYGEVVCGPPAPPNWLIYYTHQNDFRPSSGITGAWAVRSQSGHWNGILRMRGTVGWLVYVSKSEEVIEFKMSLNRSSNGDEYILQGEFQTWGNLKQEYRPLILFFESFDESFSARSCNRNREDCNLIKLRKIDN